MQKKQIVIKWILYNKATKNISIDIVEVNVLFAIVEKLRGKLFKG